MNKTAIKNFAIWARNKLISDINYRAGLLGITADGIHSALPLSTGQTQFYDIGTAEPYAITGEQIHQRQHLVDLLRQKEKESDYKTAYKYVLEEVAYTWFNRLIAVRFMEVNDYLPSHIRVLSSDSGKMEPDLVTTPFDAELVFSLDEEQLVYQLKQENKIDELFRILFIKQCNALNEILPALFEKTNDYTELLLNLSVIDQDGVVYHLVHDIPEEDFDVDRGGQVEIIGWLYQYYNTEPKNEAFAKSGKISKEEIPAVTQLFTPDWIVRYMVENSVGRLWIEHLRALDESADEATLAANFGWKYYLPEAKQEPEVESVLKKLREERASLTPEQITMIDPCMGSGHILVYGFSVLIQIYENAGYSQRDAAKSILENNLFGLDIDDRAYQMAYFAVMMKAREYNRRILNGENSCNVYAIQESNGITDAVLGDMGANLSEDERKIALKEIKDLMVEFKDAKEYGSILNVKKRDWDLLHRFAVPSVGYGQLSLDMNGTEPAVERLHEIIDIAEVMANKYFASVTNPPYMGGGKMNSNLIKFVKKYYADYKSDLFSAFIIHCSTITKANGFCSFLSPYVWMFIQSYEKMRKYLYDNCTFETLIQFEYSAFSEATVPICTFAFRNSRVKNKKACYLRLTSFRGGMEIQRIKTIEAIHDHDCGYYYERSQDDYHVIPGVPVAYWLDENALNCFVIGTPLKDISKPKTGMRTGDNDRFLRLWFEVDRLSFKTLSADAQEAQQSKKKWFPYNKGGDFRQWYGNNALVVNWENDGEEIKENTKKVYPQLGDNLGWKITNEQDYFREGLTWTALTSGTNSFRYSERGFIFDSNKGPMLFGKHDDILYLLGMLNSCVSAFLLNVINPTLSLQNGDIEKLPIIMSSDKSGLVNTIVKNCIELSKNDWDSFETSWDFEGHPLVELRSKTENSDISSNNTIKAVFQSWQLDTNARFDQLKANEEELNRIFIDIYGLNNELSPIVEDKDVAVNRADLKRDIKSLLSYAVGCMFGRYSLDFDGLVYAGGAWDRSKYITFLPDADNVIPITDEEYLEDDIVSRLCTWLKMVYGEVTVEENLDYIAKALGNKGGSSREIIRNYFMNDFFKEHCQIYSITGSGKRPIYWLFDSGKQNGFKALVYLHRYNADTIGNLRIDYLHRMQRIYESEIIRMQDMIDHSSSAREAAQATKRREKLTKQLKECREYDEKLAHLALSRIELDLDDGVKVNYRKLQTASDGKFYEVLADSKNIMSKK